MSYDEEITRAMRRVTHAMTPLEIVRRDIARLTEMMKAHPRRSPYTLAREVLERRFERN